MKRREVVLRPLALADLTKLHDYIAAEAGEAVAGGYIERIEAACRALETFPERGTRRDDLRPGIRTIGFERRVTIAFEVKQTQVAIVRVFYGRRDYAHALQDETEA